MLLPTLGPLASRLAIHSRTIAVSATYMIRHGKAAAEADASKFETATEWILATEIPLIQLPVLPCGRSFDEFHHRHGDENYDPKKYSWIRAATMAIVSWTVANNCWGLNGPGPSIVI